MEEHRCPRCGEEDEIIAYYSVVIGVTDYLRLAACILLAGAFGIYLEYTWFWACFFSALASLPFWIRLHKKKSCLQCEYDFDEDKKVLTKTRNTLPKMRTTAVGNKTKKKKKEPTGKVIK